MLKTMRQHADRLAAEEIQLRDYMLICPRTHVWLRLCGRGWAQVGFTARAVDDIGAVKKLVTGRGAVQQERHEISAKSLQILEERSDIAGPGDAAQAGQPVLRIEWTGLVARAADELYHCRKTETEGVAQLIAPAAGRLVALNSQALLDVATAAAAGEDALCQQPAVLKEEAEHDDDEQEQLLLSECWLAEFEIRGGDLLEASLARGLVTEADYLASVEPGRFFTGIRQRQLPYHLPNPRRGGRMSGPSRGLHTTAGRRCASSSFPTKSCCHYVALGVDRGASPSEIREAWMRAALRWHPDRQQLRDCTDDGSTDMLCKDAAVRFDAARQAFGVLSDPVARRAYNATVLDRPSHAAHGSALNEWSEEVDLADSTLSPAEVERLFQQCFGDENAELGGESRRASSSPSKFLSDNRYRIFKLDHRAPLWWSTVDFHKSVTGSPRRLDKSAGSGHQESAVIEGSLQHSTIKCKHVPDGHMEEDEWEVEVVPGQPQPGADSRDEGLCRSELTDESGRFSRYPKW